MDKKNPQYVECNPDKSICKGYLIHLIREVTVALRTSVEHVYKCTQCGREIK